MNNPSVLTTLCVVGLAVNALLLSSVEGKLFQYGETEAGPCILVDISFTIELTAFNSTTKVASASRTPDEVVEVTGSCGDVSAVMNLVFTNGTNWGLVFHQEENGPVVLDRLVQLVPYDVFGALVEDKDVVSFHDPNTKSLFNSSFSYECHEREFTRYINSTASTRPFGYEITVEVTSIHAQAYGVKNGKFSNSLECAGENDTTSTTAETTTTPSTESTSTATTSTESTSTATTSTESTSAATISTESTSAATTSTESTSTATTSTKSTSTATISTESTSTPATSTESTSTVTTSTESTSVTPPHPPVNNYTVKGDNITCISLQGAVTLTITYITNVSSELTTSTITVDVPASAQGNGSCNASGSTQNLVIEFFGNWSLEFVFSAGEQANLDAISNQRRSYGITNITLIYVVDHRRFPHSLVPQGTKVEVDTTSHSPDYPRKSSSTDYYTCSRDIKMELSEDVTVSVENLRFKAFNQDNSDAFTGEADTCASDSDTNWYIPLIVGCVAGGLLLVIAVIYVLVRCTNKRRYYERV